MNPRARERLCLFGWSVAVTLAIVLCIWGIALTKYLPSLNELLEAW